MVDSVCLESIGFCRGSVLARGHQHWTLAVPGRGSDEVSASPHGPLFHELLGTWFPLNWHAHPKHLVTGTHCPWQDPEEQGQV